MKSTGQNDGKPVCQHYVRVVGEALELGVAQLSQDVDVGRDNSTSFAAVKGGLQRVHAMAAGRIVTFGFAAVAIGLGVVVFA